MCILIKGKPVADSITGKLIEEVKELKDRGINPKLAIIRVGKNESDLAYERGALKRMEKCGIASSVTELPLDISQDDFIEELNKTNWDADVHGILIFRPLPPQLDEDVIKHIIAPEKDVDSLSPVNVAKVTEGDESGFPPCTPTAVMEMLKHNDIELGGKNAVVLGRSMVVGKPVAMLLLKENATVTICHSRTKDLPGICSKADILVAAVGRAEMVDASYVKEGAVVIDVGINVNEEGKLVGDVNTEECIGKAATVTPVPAGVGSVTTSVLAKHVVRAAAKK
jgi:methylenetetrahydrofolate dehydrogenase (NADP+)/methenyltetrahydrofolate cyclohydrolase